MLMNMNYSTTGTDVIAAFDVAGESYTEIWSRFKPDGQLFTSTSILTQLRNKLFNGSAIQVIRAVADMTDVFESLCTAQKPPVVPMLSFISFIEGLAKGKYKCTTEDFAKLRGYVDVLGTLLSIDKPKVYANLIDPSEISATAETDGLVKSEDDDVLLANTMLTCLVTNKVRFDTLYTVLEEYVQTYALADTCVYINRAIPELIGHIRGDIYGKVKAEAIQRCAKGDKVEDILSFIGDNRILNLELGIAKVLLVLSGLMRVRTEIKELNVNKKGKFKKVVSDLDSIIKSIATDIAVKSYDFEVADIEKVLTTAGYSVDEVAHILLAGSVEDIA